MESNRLKVKYYPDRGQFELLETFSQESMLWNSDIHPIPVKNRNWEH
ncbi:MAG: hypothetical protein RRA45_10965 [Saccharolobus sp.]|jgi:NCS1 family nucleobase:cation symporter-1|nr:hypothetical protein [Saccharolobus sp.]MDT7862714.1 hypothetical protein [Saccharolobus sp.]